jgi:hypothetical protein
MNEDEILTASDHGASPALRAQVIEECAKVAESKIGGYLCPYGRDKPGDPTWHHTDDDICPVCGSNGHDSLHKCHDTVQGRIASAIRALDGPRGQSASEAPGAAAVTNNSEPSP